TVNYRTSHQIRSQSDRLLNSGVADLDGILQNRSDTISVFNGPPPEVRTFEDENDEIEAVSKWIADRTKEGVAPHEFGIFIRSTAQLSRARAAAEKVNLNYMVLDDGSEATSNFASIATMHLAKGLEFRAVVVMACDDEVIPL